jgi:hypothetical protein
MIRAETVLRAYLETLSVLKRFKIWVPLFVYVVLKIGIMYLYLATVSGKFSSFWEVFLFGESPGSIRHYPMDHLLMPMVMNRVSLVLDVFVHVVFQCATMFMFAEVFVGRAPLLRPSFRETWARYPRLVGVSLIFSVVLFGAVFLPGYLAGLVSAGIPGLAITGASIVLGLIVQALLIFATPYVLFSPRSVVRAVSDSILVSVRSLGSSVLLVTLPFLLTLPLLYIESKTPAIVRRLSPDVLVHVQISAELVHWIGTFLLMGALTSVFIRRVQSSEPARKQY